MAIQLLPLLLFGGAAAVVLSSKKKEKKNPKASRKPSGRCVTLSELQKSARNKGRPLPVCILPKINATWGRVRNTMIAHNLIELTQAGKVLSFKSEAVAVLADAIFNELGCRSVITSAGQPRTDITRTEYRYLAAMLGCAYAFMRGKAEEDDKSFFTGLDHDRILVRGIDFMDTAIVRGYGASIDDASVISRIKADYGELLLPENPQSFDDFIGPTTELERSLQERIRSTHYLNGAGGKNSGSEGMDAWEMISGLVALEGASLDYFSYYLTSEAAAAYCSSRVGAMPSTDLLGVMSEMTGAAMWNFLQSNPDAFAQHEEYPDIGLEELITRIVAKIGGSYICFVRCSNVLMKKIHDAYFDAMKSKGYFQDEERGAAVLLLMASEGVGPDTFEEYLEWWDNLPPEVEMIFNSAPNSDARQEALSLMEQRHPALHKLYNLMVDTVIGYNEGWLEFK